MVAVSHRYELVYFPVPKNATSSIKRVFYAVDTGRSYKAPPGSGSNVHRLYSSVPSDWRDFYDLYFSFAVVRDPVKRFLSAYVDRVANRNVPPERHAKFRKERLNPVPGLEELIDNLERYRELSKGIRNHTIPQRVYVGAFWDRIRLKLPIERLSELPTILEERTGCTVALPTSRVRKRKILPAELKPAHLERLIAFYREDYDMLGDFYAPDTLREQAAP